MRFIVEATTMARQLTAHSRRSAARRARTMGSSRRLEPAPSRAMYGTGWSRATPALSTSEYAAMLSPVRSAHPVPAGRCVAAGAPVGARPGACRPATPSTTRAMPAAPSVETRSPKIRNAATGTSATPRPRAIG